MSKHWIIDDAQFGKIKDLLLSFESLKQFIDDVIYKHPNKNILLKNLSNIYVLVAMHGSYNYLKPGGITWKEIINEEQYNILEKNGTFVIAFMLITEKNQKLHYIELFDTIVRKNNLGSIMMDRYDNIHKYNINLIPQNIIETSAKYWAKELALYNIKDGKYCIDIEDIDNFIKDMELDENELDWKYLYQLCDK